MSNKTNKESGIEPSVRRLEDSLQWISPLSVLFFRPLTSISYPAIVGLSTAIGYLLFFLPAAVLSTIAVDITTGVSLFTTLSSFASPVQILNTLNYKIVAIALVVLYTGFIITYTPVNPSNASVREPYEWQRLRSSLLICGVGFAVFATDILPIPHIINTIGLLGTAWWIMRRVTYTVLFDETRYLLYPPYTEVLLATRIPVLTGVLALLLNLPNSIVITSLTIPFITGTGYFYWRKYYAGDDNTQTISTVRMVKRSGLPEELTREYGANAYSIHSHNLLLKEAAQKFNSLLETEIDTTRRVSVSTVPTESEIKSAMQDANQIYSDFENVAIRSQRFKDLHDEIKRHGMKSLEGRY